VHRIHTEESYVELGVSEGQLWTAGTVVEVVRSANGQSSERRGRRARGGAARHQPSPFFNRTATQSQRGDCTVCGGAPARLGAEAKSNVTVVDPALDFLHCADRWGAVGAARPI
jgi:hypothetical protein